MQQVHNFIMNYEYFKETLHKYIYWENLTIKGIQIKVKMDLYVKWKTVFWKSLAKAYIYTVLSCYILYFIITV